MGRLNGEPGERRTREVLSGLPLIAGAACLVVGSAGLIFTRYQPEPLQPFNPVGYSRAVASSAAPAENPARFVSRPVLFPETNDPATAVPAETPEPVAPATVAASAVASASPSVESTVLAASEAPRITAIDPAPTPASDQVGRGEESRDFGARVIIPDPLPEEPSTTPEPEHPDPARVVEPSRVVTSTPEAVDLPGKSEDAPGQQKKIDTAPGRSNAKD